MSGTPQMMRVQTSGSPRGGYFPAAERQSPAGQSPRVLDRGGAAFIPPDLFPGSIWEYAGGYVASAVPFITTVLTMYVAVVAQVDHYGAASQSAGLAINLTYVLDLIYPLVMMGGMFLVAAEVCLRKYVFFELLRNNYVIAWHKEYTKPWNFLYWVRPSFGYVPLSMLLWTVLLGLSTRAVKSTLQIVVLQLVGLLNTFNNLIDVSAQSPSLSVVYQMYLDADRDAQGAASPRASESVSGIERAYMSKAERKQDALTNMCTNLARLQVVEETRIRLDVEYLMNCVKWSTLQEADRAEVLMNCFGEKDERPLGRRNFPHEEVKKYLCASPVEWFLSLLMAGLYSKLWATKLFLFVIKTARSKNQTAYAAMVGDTRPHKRVAYLLLFVVAVSMLSIFALEVYGLTVGAKTAGTQQGTSCTVADSRPLTDQCSSRACLQATCSLC